MSLEYLFCLNCEEDFFWDPKVKDSQQGAEIETCELCEGHYCSECIDEHKKMEEK